MTTSEIKGDCNITKGKLKTEVGQAHGGRLRNKWGTPIFSRMKGKLT
jgi:uncharacterized protein YjbJ (UPF0337 family)